MLYQVLIPAPILMIPILIMTTKGSHSQKNDSGHPSDVIVTYSNHADASHEAKIPEAAKIPETLKITETVKIPETTITADFTTTAKERYYDEHERAEIVKKYKNRRPKQDNTEAEDSAQEDVVFIPNEKLDSDVIRNEEYLQNNRASLGDLLGGHQTVQDLLANRDVRLETESPVSDIIFVMGKNNDHIDKSHKKKNKEEKNLQSGNEDVNKPSKLRCNNLFCTNTIRSVCGSKVDDDYQERFRLFLNDCYFRKVNCNFRIAANRYKKVPLENCKNVAAHTAPPFSFTFKPPRRAELQTQLQNETRRSYSSRRSMAMDMNGQFCSHACPATCPGHYEPQCAVSSTGHHRVFLNHCALDHNSCSFGIVWHSVPLSQCVGGKKAELRQNAGFIGWMQRVGIVDKRGRLTYDHQ